MTVSLTENEAQKKFNTMYDHLYSDFLHGIFAGMSPSLVMRRTDPRRYYAHFDVWLREAKIKIVKKGAK